MDDAVKLQAKLQLHLSECINAQAELHAELVCIATDVIKEYRDKIDAVITKLNADGNSEHDNNIKSINFNEDDDIYAVTLDYSGAKVTYSLDDFTDDELVNIANHFVN
jgi:hypothetical protein